MDMPSNNTICLRAPDEDRGKEGMGGRGSSNQYCGQGRICNCGDVAEEDHFRPVM